MRAISKIILLAIIPITAHCAVSTAVIGASAAAASNQRQVNQQRNNQRINQISSGTHGMAKGVFICPASNEFERGYYGKQISKCRFWDSENGYFSLSLEEVAEYFLQGYEVTNVIFNSYDNEFELYYR